MLEEIFNIREHIGIVTGAKGQLGTELYRTLSQCQATMIGVDQCDYDITDYDATLKAYSDIFSEYGIVDFIINNAGVTTNTFESYEQRSTESFKHVTDTNMLGTFNSIKAYASLIKKSKTFNKKRSIINIASVYGVVSPDFSVYTDCARVSPEVYGASKAGIIQMTRYFAVALSELNVRVNCISPGGIFNKASPQGEDFVKRYSARCPMGRMSSVSEMNGAAIFLASDASSYVTGQNIIIDGGMTAW